MSPYREKESLIFTMDGNGDNTNGTISQAKFGEELTFISRSSNFNLGENLSLCNIITWDESLPIMNIRLWV